MKKILSILLIIPLLLSCGGDKTASKRIKPVKIDFEQIQEKGKLTALTGYSATSYFLYKGEPMGYEYELLQRLSDYLGVEIEIRLEKNFDTFFDRLNRGEADLIAYNLTVTKQRTEIVDFTEHHSFTRQILVQRKPDNWRQMKLHEIEKSLITNPIDLIGKTVHVTRGSAFVGRLKSLSDEIGGDIEIIEVGGDVTADDLITMVAEGEIDFTVADEHVAWISEAYYSNINVETPLSFPQRIAWAVRKTSPELLNSVNQWISAMQDCTDYYVIYNKYFKNRRAHRTRMKSDYSTVSGTQLSPYDDIIKKYAAELNWDWRLLASMIYQESEFDPAEKSWAGARGLMQLMPKTAEAYGGTNLKDPENNITAGTNFIKWLENYWQEIPDTTERLKFVLASYNVGQGHISDARKLAEKYGKDADVWDNNVDEFILKKSKKEFYDDEVVNFGYCRGEEPYNYVREILERYEQYQIHIE